ncbi:hypothetical protein Cob_v005735 [Colletotrichum orbiculare MAFF 240422]|uniref:Uncharacterized protein n=1 Tax=Colletotrichum orbiculare (strain 104-T / ATCC 96160 / CBS 514.97 / LARS 414 / MAFF 240422) TaxID=1213857 RepID=A0A484FRJ0_COLOR|nr:hypothetical protein Cob_v005735 [Colletotrichum orbiculare MAFF 240422]
MVGRQGKNECGKVLALPETVLQPLERKAGDETLEKGKRREARTISPTLARSQPVVRCLRQPYAITAFDPEHFSPKYQQFF